MPFIGFPPEAVEFYQELELNNSKDWWAANAPTYKEKIAAPLRALLDELEDEFGAAKVFRPHRDVRFSADKSPYKTHQGAYVPTGTATGWYVQIGPQGLFVGGGCYQMQTDQLARYRAAVDQDRSGTVLVQHLDALRADGFEIGGEQLASRPRGVPADHPRIELMRHKSLTVSRGYGEPEWLHTSQVRDRVEQDWRAMRPLLEWLNGYVGSSDRETGPRPRR